MYTNEYYRTQFISNMETLSRQLNGVDRITVNTIPAPKKWCIGEIVDHLLLAGRRYVEVLEAKLSNQPESQQKGSGPYTHPLLIRYFIKIVSPELKRNVPTIKPFEPHHDMNFDPETLIQEFEALNTRFLSLVDIADKHHLDLGAIKVGNPIIPFWKMSISGCLAINEAHQRRHFGQIERILEVKSSN